MSMHLTVYVGPYLVVPRSANIDLGEFDDVVYDGRGEAGVGEKEMYLVPNVSLDGVTRELRFARDDSDALTQLNPATIVRESAAMARLTEALVMWCNENDVPVHEGWGVVPGWF